EAPGPSHKHIRRCGLDFMQGNEVIAAGSLIGPADAALAIAAGHKHLPVCRKPRVAVIDSGDELSADPETCAPHQIPASNGAMLLAMARKLPVDAWRSGPVADTLDALTGAFDAAHHADVIVTSGGASVGEHDLVRPALEAWGASLDFWRVAIKPGKPILVARRDRRTGPQIVMGLPGNPVSSFVTAYHFMLPLLRRMLGARYALPMQIAAKLGAPMPANGPRRELRALRASTQQCADRPRGFGSRRHAGRRDPRVPPPKWRYCLTLQISLLNCSLNVHNRNTSGERQARGSDHVDAQAARIAPVHPDPA
ncbi:MAG: molybdopterin molybdotransferase MoeA, partial [Novosphingobium sp.]